MCDEKKERNNGIMKEGKKEGRMDRKDPRKGVRKEIKERDKWMEGRTEREGRGGINQ